jgi:periplasmic protein TonB
MKHLFLILTLLTSVLLSHAQNAVQPIGENSKVYTIVENMPEFSGGDAAMLNFIKDNIVYPDKAKENKIQGRVYVNFVVDEAGRVTSAKILRGIGGGCDEEALRVVNMMPLWKPGMQNGKTVKVVYNLPITFSL